MLPVTYWGVAEIAMCLVAASIPILRVFIRDKGSSFRLKNKSQRQSVTQRASLLHGTQRGNTIVITTENEELDTKHCESKNRRSDVEVSDTNHGHVIMTNEITVQFQDRKREDSLTRYGCRLDNV